MVITILNIFVWKQRKLGDVVNLIGGGPFKSTDSVSKGIPWLKIANVGVNGITWNTESYLPEYFWNDYPQYQLKKGNYVVALTRPILNHRLKISKLDRNVLLNQRVAKLTTSENLQYIVHLLERKKVVLQIENNLSGSDPPNLSSKDLYRIKIKIPSESNEQKQIGTFLTKLDSIISLQQRKVDLLKQLKKGLLQKMFADKDNKQPILRFEGFHDDWKQSKLGNIVSYKNGHGHEKDQFSYGKYELVNLNSISIDGGLKPSGKYINHANSTLQKGDLVMVLSDVAHGDLLGRVAIIPEDNQFVLNQRVALLRRKLYTNIYFLFSYINTHQNYFKKQGAGSSQLNISKGSVERFSVMLPTTSEQNRIGASLNNLNCLVTLQQQKLLQLTNFKKFLLQQLFV